MSNIGKNIKKARMKKNMRQEDLASRLYVTRAAVSNYETNRSNPDIETLQQIAEVLDTDVNTLIYGETKKKVDRKPVYIMMIILILALILLFPVSSALYMRRKNNPLLLLEGGFTYLAWMTIGRGILTTVILTIVVYLFLYALQIRLPHPKARRVLSYLFLLAGVLFPAEGFLNWKGILDQSLWGTLLVRSSDYPFYFGALLGILFGICSYQTLFFTGIGIKGWFQKYKWILSGGIAGLIAVTFIIDLTTRKEYEIYGTIANFPYDVAIEIDVDTKNTNEEALEEISYHEDLYALENDWICNLDDIPNGSMKEGDTVKIVIRQSLLQDAYNRYYLFIVE